MKTLSALISLTLLSANALALDIHSRADATVATLYTKELKSSVHVRVSYPNMPAGRIRTGQYEQVPNSQADCLALTYSNGPSVDQEKMLELAKALKVTELVSLNGGEIAPKIINGTVVFQLENNYLYVTDLLVETRDGKPFGMNKSRIVGEKGYNMILQYIRNCASIVN